MKAFIVSLLLFSSVAFAGDCEIQTDPQAQLQLQYYMSLNVCHRHPKTCADLNLSYRVAVKKINALCGCTSNGCPGLRLKPERCEGQIISFQCAVGNL